MYKCPVCGESLKRLGNVLHCRERHSFDIAAKGYVNLLTTKGRNPKKAGDDPEMVRARSAFLDKGYYRPLAERLRETLEKELAGTKNPVVIDSGCGEGYYTAELSKLPGARIYGIDISKHAVAHCMTRVHLGGITNCEFAAASSFDLPFGDGCADGVVSVFAPVANDEYCRVLKNSGALVVVSPSAAHLFELKAVVYDEPYENRPNRYGLNKFLLSHEETLEYKAHISSQEDIKSLFMMTPYCYKTSEEGTKRLETLDSIDVTCGFVIQTYKKKEYR